MLENGSWVVAEAYVTYHTTNNLIEAEGENSINSSTWPWYPLPPSRIVCTYSCYIAKVDKWVQCMMYTFSATNTK